MEQVFYKLENFFTNNTIVFTYYDLYFTEKELLLVYLNETHRSFLVRNPKAGEKEREKLEELSYSELMENSDDNIIINKDDICNIEIARPSFIRNTAIKIELEDKVINLFTKDKNKDLDKLTQTLKNNSYPI